jgi:hypothetical protein
MGRLSGRLHTAAMGHLGRRPGHFHLAGSSRTEPQIGLPQNIFNELRIMFVSITEIRSDWDGESLAIGTKKCDVMAEHR